jgi:hypothetical protein
MKQKRRRNQERKEMQLNQLSDPTTLNYLEKNKNNLLVSTKYLLVTLLTPLTNLIPTSLDT